MFQVLQYSGSVETAEWWKNLHEYWP